MPMDFSGLLRRLLTDSHIYFALKVLLAIMGLLDKKAQISGEILFAAASLNFMSVNRFFAPDPAVGQIFVLFIMGLAAAEVAIALSIVIAVYRNYGSIKSRELSDLKR